MRQRYAALSKSVPSRCFGGPQRLVNRMLCISLQSAKSQISLRLAARFNALKQRQTLCNAGSHFQVTVLLANLHAGIMEDMKTPMDILEHRATYYQEVRNIFQRRLLT